MKKCTNNRTMSFRRLLSLLLGLVLFMELLPGGLTVVGDASDAVTVTVDGAAASADANDLSDLLRLISMAGAGRTGTAPADPPLITVDYGDGTTLDIWQVPLENPANDWTEGPFFRCTFPGGKTYGYDTDQIPMTRLTHLFS